MTRKTRREIENDIKDVAPDDDTPAKIIIRRTVVGTDWDGGDDDLEPGENVVEEKVIELRPGASSSSNGDGGADD